MDEPLPDTEEPQDVDPVGETPKWRKMHSKTVDGGYGVKVPVSKYRYFEMLVNIGDYDKAAAYADKYKIKWSPPPKPEPPPPPPEKPISPAGWPIESTAVISSRCINRRLCLITLPDNRVASVWNGPRGYAVGSHVHVRLESDSADPLYVVTGAL